MIAAAVTIVGIVALYFAPPVDAKRHPRPTPTPSLPTAAPAPPSGSGCVFTEAQSWWTTTPGKTGTNFGHLHVGACMPFKQVVSGTLTLDVRLILHDNPGTFDYLNPVLKTDSQELSLPHVTTLNGWKCSGTCDAHATISVDTRLSNYDGVQELRIRTYVNEPDGNRMHASVNTLLDLRNGKPVNAIDRMPYQRAKGWYTGSGYCEADILTDLPIGPVSSWSPTVQNVNHSDSLAITAYRWALDADAHAGIPGTTLAQGTGQRSATTLSLSGLSAGPHKLSGRSDCNDPRGSTNSGVLVVSFEVP